MFICLYYNWWVLKNKGDIIKKVFGSEDFKLSQAVPSQSSLVEYFIDEVKHKYSMSITS